MRAGHARLLASGWAAFQWVTDLLHAAIRSARASHAENAGVVVAEFTGWRAPPRAQPPLSRRDILDVEGLACRNPTNESAWSPAQPSQVVQVV